MHYLNEENLFIFLIQILILLGLARGLGEVFRRFKQPTITAEILVGIFLGPSLLGRFFPGVYSHLFPKELIQQNMLETMAWIGILFFLLKTGLEIDFSSAWRQKGDALTISISDIFIPMLIATIPCYFLPAEYMGDPSQRFMFSLFIATIMTISALPVTARILQDLSLYKTDVGFLIMSALSVNDIIGWLIFTLIMSFFSGGSSMGITKVVVIFTFTIGFVVFCLTLGRKFSNYVISKFKEKEYPEPGSSLTFICLLGIICGAITLKIGIHALFGFFIAGIIAGEAKELSEKTRHVISEMVHALFIPIFFTTIGLKIDFFSHFDLFLVMFMIVIGIIGRFVGAWIGVSLTKQSRANRLLISIAHTPGGEMQIVVGILALELNLITEPVFVAIVSSAIISSIILGPWMTYALKIRKEINFLEFFLRRAILPDLKSIERDDAIKEICEVVSEQEGLNKDEIIKTVIERENQIGTGLELGGAIPHGRISNLKKPIIAYGKSKLGIEWNTLDGNPVHNIFLILSPKEDKGFQLQILRNIAIVLKNDDIREKLIISEKYEHIWDVINKSFSSYNIKNN